MSRDRDQRTKMLAQIAELQQQVAALRAELERLAPKPVKASAPIVRK